MDSYIVKVQHENSLRRLNLSRADELVFSYSQLVRKARDLFQLPSTIEIVLTYIDKEGDVVTMAEDQDLKDALVLQSLNPLRLTLTIVNKNAPTAGDVKVDAAVDAGKQLQNSDSEMLEEAVSSGSVQQGQATSDVNDKTTSIAAAEPTTDNKGVPEGASNTAAEAKDESEQHVLHHGIICDGCGKSPIAGTRFKANKKVDYDLCRSCFEAPGIDPNDFFKIDRQFSRYGHPFARRMLRISPAFSSRTPPNTCRANSCPANAVGAGSDRCNQSGRCPPVTASEKPAADPSVAVHNGVTCDCCRISPIAGPRFKSITRFNYDLCLGCFQKGGSNAGEYSRLDQPAAGNHPLVLQTLARFASPYGTMCGRRGVWVLHPMIPGQTVGPSTADEKTAALPGDAQVNQADPAAAQAGAKEVPAEAKEMAAAAEAEHQAHENLSQTGATTASELEGVAVPAPQVDVDAKAEETKELNVGSAAVEKQGVPEDQGPVNNSGEEDLVTFEGLVAKLSGMGFNDQKLNEELLKKNKFDLRTTLDDLCAAEEWDPILEELQEMGFYDSDMNRRLMFKNNGSVKRVVKELVQLYKEPASRSGN